MIRTFEQKVKFDNALPIGVSCVKLTKAGRELIALIEISNRGKVAIMMKPDDGDMYTAWRRIDGDAIGDVIGSVIVWAARSEAFNEKYAEKFATPIANIEI